MCKTAPTWREKKQDDATNNKDETILNANPVKNQRLSSLFRFDQAPNVPSTRPDNDILKHPLVSPKTHFGFEIPFCPLSKGGRHMTPQQLEPYRQIGDPPLDELMDYMASRGFPLKPQDDLLQVRYPPYIQTHIDEFVRYYSRVPDWVDPAQLERGQSVFLRYTGAITVSLYHRSLVAGFSIPKIARVVCSTAYLAPPSSAEQVGHRLQDTGALVASCMGFGSAPLLPGGEAWRTALYVRILHAKVRRTLLQQKKWDVDQYGIPINQEDMAATLLAFSINALDGVEFVGGMAVPKQDQEDYLALWRYIGWILGVYTSHDDDKALPCTTTTPLPPSLDPCGPGWYEKYPSPLLHSRHLLQSMLLHLLHPDESSVSVSHHILGAGTAKQQETKHGNNHDDNGSSPNKISRTLRFYLRAYHCRCMIGDSLADALELPFAPDRWMRWRVYWRSRLFWWALRLYTWAGRVPVIRKRIFDWQLGILQKFYESWKENHPTRMAEGIRNAHRNDPEGRESEKGLSRACPFAMISNPQL